MAVTVNKGFGTQATFAEAESITVSDGHLMVNNGEGYPVAIFAPSHWIRAEKDLDPK